MKVIDGNWFACPPSVDKTGTAKHWQVIEKSELDHWVAAWHGGEGLPPDIFRSEILDDEMVYVLARYVGEAIAEGGIVDMSHDVAGLSNWFGSPNNESVPSGLIAAVSAGHPVPVVCWSDASEAIMNASGFSAIGPMAVWINQA